MLVTNLLFLRGFILIHRAFIRNYVMIFQDLINIFEVLERKGLCIRKPLVFPLKLYRKHPHF